MNGMVLLLALAAPGIDYGWRPGADGQLEYIVQLEPELVEALRLGREVRSDIHPQARGMRRFIIRQGTGELPQHIGDTTRVAQRGLSSSPGHGGIGTTHVVQSSRILDDLDDLPEGVQTGWQATDNGQLEFIIQLDSSALDRLQEGEQLIGEIDPEVTQVSRLLIRHGDSPPSRVDIAMTSGTQPLAADRRSGNSRAPAETPVMLQGSSIPRSPAAGGANSNQRSIYGGDNSASATSTGNSTFRNGGTASNSTGAPAASRDSRSESSSSGGGTSTRNGNSAPVDPTAGVSPLRPGTSPWTNAANAPANPPNSGTNTLGSQRGSDSTGGADSRASAQNPNLLQAPPTEGFRYSDMDFDDGEDQWNSPRGDDRGWQQQGANLQAPHPDFSDDRREYRDERPRDWESNPRRGSSARDYGPPRYASGSEHPGERYERGDDPRAPASRAYDDRRYLEYEHYATGAGAPPPRVARASAETASDREVALERELAQERQKALERRLEEQERALASIAAARPTRRPDVEGESTGSPRTTNTSRESGPEDRLTTALRSASTRSPASERGGDLLKELILFASLGMNIVAVLIARQYYMRYRMLIREMRDPVSLTD